MCKCNPSIRTPFCGRPGCEWPGKPLNSRKGMLINLIKENKETFISSGPIDQHDADEPRYRLVITGPERLVKELTDLLLK